MERGKRVLYNTMANGLTQIISLVSGFILPRLILSSFGSSYNGITSSVSQFLSVIVLLRAGIGGATRSSLYKSLATNDLNQVSATLKATEKFMRKVAFAFLSFMIAFACIYPYFVKDEFSWLFAFSLVLIISISTFLQYYFGITYQMLLQADQKQYVYSLIETVSLILNTLFAVILIKYGFGIHGVKLGSALAFSVTPFALNIYVKKHYKLINNIKPDYSSIGQRWDAFYHQVATFIHENTDITLLTIFSNTREISVYTVYYLVGNGLKKIVFTISSGVEAAFGNIIANDEDEALRKNLHVYENFIHIISSAIFSAAFVLITPFVKVYTNGITDVNYVRYLFGYLVIISQMLYCLRTPYEVLVNAAGHFKQTKKYAFTEAGLNLFVSICMVWRFGLVGVVIGTTVAILFRNIAYGVYISKHIVKRSVWVLVKRFFITSLAFLMVLVVSLLVPIQEMDSYLSWIVYAIVITLIAILSVILINFIFYKNELIMLIHKLESIGSNLIK